MQLEDKKIKLLHIPKNAHYECLWDFLKISKNAHLAPADYINPEKRTFTPALT